MLGCMNRFVREAIDIKLHPDNIRLNREEGFKLRKAWNLNTRLLSHCNIHTSRKSQVDTEKSMQKKKQLDNRDTRLSNTARG
jgi:hypothetical protein